MARRRSRSIVNDNAEVDMTPMLDIVFILLIFFIVTAVFLDESGIDFTSQKGPEPITPTPSIQVTLNEKSQATVGGRNIPLPLVLAEVQYHLAEKPGAAISFRASEKARLHHVVFIKDSIENAGLQLGFETYAEAERSARLD